MIEVNGPSNILLILEMAYASDISPKLKAKIKYQAEMLVEYMREYDKNGEIKWHEIIERAKNEKSSNKKI